MNQTQLSELLHRAADEIPVGQPPPPLPEIDGDLAQRR